MSGSAPGRDCVDYHPGPLCPWLIIYHGLSSSLVPHCPRICPTSVSHVANFWKQGGQASFRLEALPSGKAELNLSFQLHHASEVIPPPSAPSQVFPAPAPQRPIHPLFPKGFFPQRSGVTATKSKPACQKKPSSKQCKSYRRSVLHRASLAVPTLSPPKNGSLRQAALASVQRLQADSASPVNTQNTRKPVSYTHLTLPTKA